MDKMGLPVKKIKKQPHSCNCLSKNTFFSMFINF